MNKLPQLSLILVLFITLALLGDILRAIPGISALARDLPYPVFGEILSLVQIFLVISLVMLWRKLSLIGALADIGLVKHALPAVKFGLFATSPMWLIFLLTTPINTEFSIHESFYLAFASPMAEEIVFRGFAFIQIRRYIGLGFWPAALITALAFGAGHVGINQDPGQALGVFLITGIGGIVFAWVYEKWNFNLWIPFVLHCFMNLNWQVYIVGESAFAG